MESYMCSASLSYSAPHFIEIIPKKKKKALSDLGCFAVSDSGAAFSFSQVPSLTGG